ncbi:MAG: hypothetical protein WD275_05215 [Rhodothermales bacterium]
MNERKQERQEQYKRVRTDFEDLSIEDKALFILEATVSTLARGIEQFGRVVSDQVNDIFSGWKEPKPESGPTEPPAGPTGASADEPVGGTA